jgi:nucleoredoxin
MVIKLLQGLENILGSSSLISGTEATSSTVSLDSLHGKTVGLYFSATWCQPCQNFTQKLVEFYRLMNANGKVTL